MTLRNQKQASSLSVEGAQCSLFEQPKKKARVRTPRHQLEAMRQAPDSICLELEVNGIPKEVEVLRPVHPGDNLFVAYQAEMLAAVLHHLRASGFEEAPRCSKPAGLPKGIRTRKGGGYIVKYTKASGSIWVQDEAHLGCSYCLPGRPHR